MAAKKVPIRGKRAPAKTPRKRAAVGGATKRKQVAVGDVSPSAYAKARGVSRQAVAKAIEEGRLTKSARKVGARWKINPDLADEEWAAATMPRKERPDLASGSAHRQPSMSLVEAKTLTEESRAELEAIKLDQLRGDLIPVAEVERQFMAVARETRDAVLRVASRVAAEIAAEVVPANCELILERYLVEALEELATNQLAEGAA